MIQLRYRKINSHKILQKTNANLEFDITFNITYKIEVCFFSWNLWIFMTFHYFATSSDTSLNEAFISQIYCYVLFDLLL